MKKSFRSKLLISFLLLSMIPLAIMTSLSFNFSNNVIYKNTEESAQIIIDRVRDELDGLFNDTLSFALSISENAIILEALMGNFEKEDRQYKLNAEAGEELLKLFSRRSDIFGITVIGENGQFLFGSDQPEREEDYRIRYWYREVLQSPFIPTFTPPHRGSYIYREEDDNLFSIGIPVESPVSSARIGVVIIEIREEVLRDILTSRLGDTGYLFIQYGRSGFTSSGDKAPDSEYLVRLANNDPIDDALLSKKREMVLIRELSLGGLKLASVIDLVELTRDSRQIGLYMAVLILITMSLSILMAALISRSIAHPVQDLRALMIQAETGDLTVRANHIHNDELGDLGHSFNSMIERIDGLMLDVKNDQIKLRKAELKTLQAQINPHFLYNTLDSINWLSRNKRNDEIIELVTALTTLFRTGISRGQDIIPVSEEIRHIESYLTIQKIRYENKFSYELDIDEPVLDQLIIKLILQPLVENALYHGIKMQKGKGSLQIRARGGKKFILFEISDNGAGMTEKRLAEVLKEMKSTEEEGEHTVYGLKNVYDRLRIYYGETADLLIHSEEGEGTVVTVKIPAKGEDHVA